jgi:hypothetical protein
LKYDHSFDDNIRDSQAEFIKTWIQLFPTNIKGYVKAYALETVGFWKLGSVSTREYGNIYINENPYGIDWMIADETARDTLRNAFNATLISAGTVFWILLFFLTISLLVNRQFLLTFSPLIGLYITVLLATPTGFGLRYVWLAVMILPLAIVAPCIINSKRHPPTNDRLVQDKYSL